MTISFLLTTSESFSPMEKLILIQPVLTGNLLAGTLLGMEQVDVKERETVFSPQGAYYLVLPMVPRQADLASTGDWLEMYIFRPHSKPSKSQTLGVTPSHLCLKKPTLNKDYPHQMSKQQIHC